MTCLDLLNAGYKTSGMYWVRPLGKVPFLGYCDMESYGGGWLVCYTTDGPVSALFPSDYRSISLDPELTLYVFAQIQQVDIAREYRYDGAYPYRTAGYRSDCRDYSFNEIMFMDESVHYSGVGVADRSRWRCVDAATFSFASNRTHTFWLGRCSSSRAASRSERPSRDGTARPWASNSECTRINCIFHSC